MEISQHHLLSRFHHCRFKQPVLFRDPHPAGGDRVIDSNGAFEFQQDGNLPLVNGSYVNGEVFYAVTSINESPSQTYQVRDWSDQYLPM